MEVPGHCIECRTASPMNEKSCIFLSWSIEGTNFLTNGKGVRNNTQCIRTSIFVVLDFLIILVFMLIVRIRNMILIIIVDFNSNLKNLRLK